MRHRGVGVFVVDAEADPGSLLFWVFPFPKEESEEEVGRESEEKKLPFYSPPDDPTFSSFISPSSTCEQEQQQQLRQRQQHHQQRQQQQQRQPRRQQRPRKIKIVSTRFHHQADPTPLVRTGCGGRKRTFRVGANGYQPIRRRPRQTVHPQLQGGYAEGRGGRWRYRQWSGHPIPLMGFKLI